MSARPLWGNVLIRPEKTTQTTKGGIELPDTAPKGNVITGTVIARGAGSLAFDGSPISMEPGTDIGSRVMFKKYEAEEVTVNGEKLYVVDQRQVILVLS